MESYSNVTPRLTKNGHCVKIGRKKFIQMDGLLVHNTNPFDFTIKEHMCVCIYYEKMLRMSKDESLKIPYPI